MRPSELSEVLTNVLRNGVKTPVVILGGTGIGKSSIVAQAAQANEMQMIDVRLGQLAPTDLRGLPVADLTHDTFRYLPASFLPKGGNGVLFMDEWNMAPPAVQQLMQQLTLDRKMGDYELPDGWVVWAAGNRLKDGATVYKMPGPLANRFIHLEVDPDSEDTINYGFEKNWHESVIAFLKTNPGCLHVTTLPENTQKNIGNAFPSPRSWETVSKLMNAKLPNLVEGTIGSATAAMFNGFRKVYQSMPDPDAILSGKLKEFAIDTSNLGTVWAVTFALATRVLSGKGGPPAHSKRMQCLVHFLHDNMNDVASEGLGLVWAMLQGKMDMATRSLNAKICETDKIFESYLKV